jgi:hypothetical protein
MKFSMTTQENVDCLIEVTAWAGLTVYSKSIDKIIYSVLPVIVESENRTTEK